MTEDLYYLAGYYPPGGTIRVTSDLPPREATPEETERLRELRERGTPGLDAKMAEIKASAAKGWK